MFRRYAVRSDGSLSPSVREYAATAGASADGSITVNTEWCVRISTGGVLPPGADAVVQVEDTEVVEADTVSDLELRIQIRKRPIPAENVREIGSDFQEGSVLVERGDRISAGTVGLLVMAGQCKTCRQSVLQHTPDINFFRVITSIPFEHSFRRFVHSGDRSSSCWSVVNWERALKRIR